MTALSTTLNAENAFNSAEKDDEEMTSHTDTPDPITPGSAVAVVHRITPTRITRLFFSITRPTVPPTKKTQMQLTWTTSNAAARAIGDTDTNVK
jgi:hypothetical protein